MSHAFNSIGERYMTFKTFGVVEKGTLVNMSANKSVGPILGIQTFIGVVTEVNGEYATVQVQGCVEIPYTGSMAIGNVCLIADGPKTVKTSSSGGTYLVVNVDVPRKILTIILK